MEGQQALQQFSHIVTSGENDASVVFSWWESITVITISLSISEATIIFVPKSVWNNATAEELKRSSADALARQVNQDVVQPVVIDALAASFEIPVQLCRALLTTHLTL